MAPIELRGPILDLGILRDTLLPSFALNSTLSLLTYSISRSTNNPSINDSLHPASSLLNAWYFSIGRRVFAAGVSPLTALRALSRPEYLLLGGVTVWSGRALYHAFIKAREDTHPVDPETKAGFWNAVLPKILLPQILAQTIISLPFTAPFAHQGGVFTGYHPYIQALAIAVYGTGFAMGVWGDLQADKSGKGVRGVVKEPRKLGDFLVNASFPMLLFASDMLAPVELLAPVASYLFLRYWDVVRENGVVAGEKVAVEAHGEDVNPFWPSVKQLSNPWLWNTIGLGVAFAAVEQIVHQMGFD